MVFKGFPYMFRGGQSLFGWAFLSHWEATCSKEGIVRHGRPGVAMQGVCPTSTKPGASAQGTQGAVTTQLY